MSTSPFLKQWIAKLPIKYHSADRAVFALVSAVLCASVGGCAPAVTPVADGAPTNAAHGDHDFGFAWFAGTVDQAFAAARQQQRPLFLYWGAVWCPPCRALKAEVFPEPRFAERMRGFIPVYLDGDAPDAQRWADKLAVSSYPTLLVLDGDGQERMRILGFAELDEIDAALAGALSAGGALQARVARALAHPESLSADDWRLLALTTWADPAIEPAGGLAPVITTLLHLAAAVPPAQSESAARLSGALLELAAEEPNGPAATDPALTKARAEARAACEPRLHALLADRPSLLAARTSLLEAASDIALLCAPDVKQPAHLQLAQRLADALQTIGGAANLPLETRFDASVGQARLWKQAHPGEAVPAPLRELAQAKVHQALSGAIPDSQRHTVITSAADALHAWGDDAGAHDLLIAELAHSRVPWYLQGELAAIEAGRGNANEALRWSAEAVRSAQGGATQVQWRASELKQLVALRPASMDGDGVTLLRAFYDLVFSLPDGFAGRNKRRLGMVAKALNGFAAHPPIRSLLEEESARCAALDAPAHAVCGAHFQSLAPIVPNSAQ